MATPIIHLSNKGSGLFMQECESSSSLQFNRNCLPESNVMLERFQSSGNCKIAEDYLRNECNVSCKIIPIAFDTTIVMHMYSTDLIYEVQFELELHFASDSDRILYEITNPCFLPAIHIKRQYET